MTATEHLDRLLDLAYRHTGEAFELMGRVVTCDPDETDIRLADLVARSYNLVKCWDCLDRGCPTCCDEETFE